MSIAFHAIHHCSNELKIVIFSMMHPEPLLSKYLSRNWSSGMPFVVPMSPNAPPRIPCAIKTCFVPPSMPSWKECKPILLLRILQHVVILLIFYNNSDWHNKRREMPNVPTTILRGAATTGGVLNDAAMQGTNAATAAGATEDFPPLLMRRYELRILPLGRRGSLFPFEQQHVPKELRLRTLPTNMSRVSRFDIFVLIPWDDL